MLPAHVTIHTRHVCESRGAQSSRTGLQTCANVLLTGSKPRFYVRSLFDSTCPLQLGTINGAGLMGPPAFAEAKGKGGGFAVPEPAHRQLGCHGSAHPTAGAMYMAVRSRPPAHGPVLARLAKHQGPLLQAQPTETPKGSGPSCWPPCSSTTPTATPDAGEGAAKPDLPPPAPPAPLRSAI